MIVFSKVGDYMEKDLAPHCEVNEEIIWKKI